MKTKLLILCLVCLLCFCSCRVADDEAITGDVKNDKMEENVDALEENIQSRTDIPENEQKNENEMTSPENVQTDIEEVIVKLGAAAGDGGEYKTEAERLCSAIVSKDTETFAEFAGGKKEYYDFLKEVEISSFALYPFEFTEEKLWQLNEEYLYPSAQDNYFAEFVVKSGNGEEFTTGKCVYYIGLEMNPVSGSLISVFVPIEKAESKVFSSFETDFTETFMNEFASLYPLQSMLYEGRNYADSFDFANHPHLITHLMATSGKYDYPPYTKDEINGFITECFYENDGLETEDFNNGKWISPVYEASEDSSGIYGCSFGHGGTNAVYDIVSTLEDRNEKIITMQLYADYARVAKAYTLVFHFESAQDACPCLTLVEKHDDTGRGVALLSV